MMQFGDFIVITRIGQGSFGQVYVVRNSVHDIFAAKAESTASGRKALRFEIKVLKSLQVSKYVPRFVSSGETHESTYLIMELLGPSLTSVLKRLGKTHFSISSGLRVGWHVLHALEDCHKNGIIHRDVKPGNILVTDKPTHPIALIDFGLSRVYVDHKGGHVSARPNPGFRGTAAYASINAHMHADLSRRDDLISWFYVIIDIMTEGLPWKKFDNRADILNSKRRLNVNRIFENDVPELCEIWEYINTLSYMDRPDYDLILDILETAMLNSGINMTDPYDWKDMPIEKHRDTEMETAEKASLALSSGGEENMFEDRLVSRPSTIPLIPKESKCCC